MPMFKSQTHWLPHATLNFQGANNGEVRILAVIAAVVLRAGTEVTRRGRHGTHQWIRKGKRSATQGLLLYGHLLAHWCCLHMFWGSTRIPVLFFGNKDIVIAGLAIRITTCIINSLESRKRRSKD